MPAGFRLRGWLSFCLGVALLVAAPRSFSLEPEIRLLQVQHTAFSGEWPPAGMRALLQGQDGQFLLGGTVGLVRFDGAKWETTSESDTPLPANSITAGCSASDGSLWLGFESGGVTRAGNRHRQDFTRANGVPGGVVHQVYCAADGSVWVAAEGGLARWRDGQWIDVGSEWHLTGPAVAVLVSADSVVWVATRTDLFRRDPSGLRRVAALNAGAEGDASLAQSPDGTLWIGTVPEGLLRLQPRQDVPERISATAVTSLLIDRDGCVWIGGAGLRRACGSNPAETMSRSDGLTSNDVRALFEDREGNVWAATAAGLDRFTQRVFVVAALPAGLDGRKALVAGKADELWMGDRAHDAVLRLNGTDVTQRLSVPSPELGYRDRDGAIWFIGERGLTRVSPGAAQTWPLPQAAQAGRVRAMASDADGALWISFGTRGLFRFARGRWLEGSGVASLPAAQVNALAADAEGSLWLGYASGQLARVGNGAVEVFGEREGLHVGLIQTLFAAGPRLWIGGDNALALREGGQFHVGRQTNCGPVAPIRAMLESADGALWLGRPRGFAAFKNVRQEIIANGPPIDCTPYRADAGVPQIVQLDSAGVPLAQTEAGRLWVVTGQQLAWTDSKRLNLPVVPPTVTVDYLEGSQKVAGPGGDLRFPQGTSEMSLYFSIWHLADAEHTRFRHRLRGVHDEWQSNLSSLRQIHLFNLGPGRYVFEISAQVSTEQKWGPVTAVTFEILPFFYQTWWFYALIALAVLAVIAVLFRIQLRRANARVRERMETRMLERERIARELHDTLLQGLQGLIFHFQAIAARVPRSDPTVGMMESVLNRADAILIESRDRVAELRESPPMTVELPDTVTRAAQQLVQGRPLDVRTKVHGHVRALDATANEEIFLIAREALSNAVRHAQASCIDVDLRYERSCVRLSVRDDGTGIDTEVVRAGGREGHFGLRGMHERARRLRGWVRIVNRVPHGTEVEVRIPASLAYARKAIP